MPLEILNKDEIVVFDEFKWNGHTISSGDHIRVKWERGRFTFRRAIFHEGKNVKWFDCQHESGSYHSFYMFKLGGLYG